MITHYFEPVVGLYHDGIAKEQTHSPHGLKQEEEERKSPAVLSGSLTPPQSPEDLPPSPTL